MKASDYLIISKKTICAYNKMCSPILEKYDIPQVSFDILMFLTNNPEYVTAQDISEIKGLKKNLVSVHVEKLVNTGLLERGFVSGDRRKVSLRCTTKAEPIIANGLAVQKSFYERITNGIAVEDWAAFKRINDLVIENTKQILNEKCDG